MFEETSATTLRLRQSVEDLRRAAGQFRLPPAESWDQAGSEGVQALA
jgi:hypothetical protein